ncbi:SPW repeat protein [Streptomyces anandii]|uniref:SPW repeat domain-containing protein n=1 Tax=Streptomyces anandii TaxID=285454 RepID=UPI0036F9EA2F
MPYSRHRTRSRQPGTNGAAARSGPTAPGASGTASALILLTGVYTAVSPWWVDFTRSDPYLTVSDLLAGVAVTLLACGMPLAAGYARRLSWAAAPIGLWLLLSPAVVAASHGVSSGILWSNGCAGGVTYLLALIAIRSAPGAAR